MPGCRPSVQQSTAEMDTIFRILYNLYTLATVQRKVDETMTRLIAKGGYHMNERWRGGCFSPLPGPERTFAERSSRVAATA